MRSRPVRARGFLFEGADWDGCPCDHDEVGVVVGEGCPCAVVCAGLYVAYGLDLDAVYCEFSEVGAYAVYLAVGDVLL